MTEIEAQCLGGTVGLILGLAFCWTFFWRQGRSKR